MEDLGRHAESFAALRRAADLRRAQLTYRVTEDVATMSDIAAAFDGGYPSRQEARGGSRGDDKTPPDDAAPIFIVGLPRSGTTLVDRILSSHSAVHSRGESSDVAAAVTQIAGAAPTKAELVRRAAAADARELARRYFARLPPAPQSRIIDKTPMNFLYLGLIAAGMPGASLIHVRRGPLDVCYAMYKTLFRMAYPFTYDFADLAQYTIAYHQLMAHWRELLGDRLIEVDYEELVADQEGQTRRLLAACRLPWQAACLDFHRNASPSLTASAAQVRQPMYRSSVGLWRRYAGELAPLAALLRAAGIEPE